MASSPSPATEPPIIYLHGFASGPTSGKARFFVDQFAKHGIAIAVPELDQGDFFHLTITGQLAVVERLAGGKPVRLIGSSMGGYLAALYASRHPETERIALFAPAFGFARRWAAELGEAKVAAWKQAGRMKYFHHRFGEERELGYGLLEDAARYPDEPAVTQPALILHGSKDVVVPPEASVQFASTRENVQLEILDSDHQLTDVMETLWDRVAGFFGNGKAQICRADVQ